MGSTLRPGKTPVEEFVVEITSPADVERPHLPSGCRQLMSTHLQVPRPGHRAPGLTHHRRMPRGIPDQFHFGIVHAFEVQQGHLHAAAKTLVHRAARRRQRHGYFHFRAKDGDIVDQAKVHEVAADFWINDLTQGVEDDGFVELMGVHADAGGETFEAEKGVSCG